MASVIERLSIPAHSVVGLDACLIALVSITLFLRFYSKHTLKTLIGADDWLILPCWLCFLAICILGFIGVRNKVVGFSTPSNLGEANDTARTAAQVYVAFDIFQPATLGGTKISAILFFRRVFGAGGGQLFSKFTATVIVVLLLWTLLFVIMDFFQCGTHLDALWHQDDSLYSCRIEQPLYLGFSISDSILYVVVMLIPLPNIWMLHLPVRKKIATTAVYFLSFVGLAASIVRLVIYASTTDSLKHPKEIFDPRVVNTSVIFFGTLEAGITLIVVNLPTLYGLVSRPAPEGLFQGARRMLSLDSFHYAPSDKVDPRRYRGSTKKLPSVGRCDSQLFQPKDKSGITVSTSSGSRFVDNETMSAIAFLRGGPHDENDNERNDAAAASTAATASTSEDGLGMRQSAIYVTKKLSVTTEYRTEEV